MVPLGIVNKINVFCRRRLIRKTESKQLLDEEYNINGSAVVDNTVSNTINKPVKETSEKS